MVFLFGLAPGGLLSETRFKAIRGSLGRRRPVGSRSQVEGCRFTFEVQHFITKYFGWSLEVQTLSRRIVIRPNLVYKLLF